MISPVSGVVKEISNEKIGVYIRGPFDEEQDDHTIYAPINGKLIFEYFDGIMKDKDFFSNLNKKGYIKFTIGSIKFNVYVGKGYVTNQIKMFVENNNYVKKKEKLGEIVIDKYNSYATIYPPYSIKTLKIGDIIIGGKTVFEYDLIGTILIDIDNEITKCYNIIKNLEEYRKSIRGKK